MKIAYVDTETTGTHPGIHELWEVALVLEDDGVVVGEHQWFAHPARMEAADPRALEIGGYWDRIPALDSFSGPWPHDVAGELARLLRDRRFASCNVAFDTAFVRMFQQEYKQPVTWHYSPIDVKSLCYGVEPTMLGAKTDELLSFFEVAVPAIGERHTALYDARAARALLHEAIRLQRRRAELPHDDEELRQRILNR